MKQLFAVKDGVNIEDLQLIHPNLLILWTVILLYCEERTLPCVVNSLINDRDNVVSTSATHAEGRGLDLSSENPPDWKGRKWNDLERWRFVHFINTNYKALGAYSRSDNVQRPVIFKDKSKRHEHHFHIQANRVIIDNVGLYLNNLK